MSYTAITAQIISTIQKSALVTLVLSRIGSTRPLTVKSGFKTRQEINVSDLPLVLVVRPERKMQIISAKQYEHSVILFVGIHCESRETAPGLLDDLENAIEDALTQNYTLNGTAVEVNYIASANDMGTFHPVYFTTMQFDITARK
jgi:hypothetical protein